MAMADSESPPAKLGDIIDYIEKVREELLTIQRSLEKLEPAESAAPDGGPMPCDVCSSTNLAEFTVEMMIHSSALRSAEDPGVLVLPKLLICLDCGGSRFTTPDAELRILRERMRPSAA